MWRTKDMFPTLYFSFTFCQYNSYSVYTADFAIYVSIGIWTLMGDRLGQCNPLRNIVVPPDRLAMKKAVCMSTEERAHHVHEQST